MDLRGKALAGVKWTSISSIANTIIQIVQLIILARILNATDFGLMAIVSVVIGFADLFVDMGISNAIIYKQNIENTRLSSLFWINIIIGIIFFISLVILSPLLASYYNNYQLKPLISLVAITFIIKPWGQQFMVILQKNMIFEAIALSDMTARAVSFVTVITLASMGYGVYSLAIGTLLSSTVATLGYIIRGYKYHIPRFYINLKDVREFISFGLFQMGEKLLQYLSSQFDTIIIGKILGIEVLGIYNIAKNLVSRPSSIINPVVTKVTFPIMAQISGDVERLKTIYLKTIHILTSVNVPVYTLIAVFAKPLVLIMFGEKWIESVFVIQALAIAYIFRSIGNPAGSLLLSRGKANVIFYWTLFTFTLYPIFITIGTTWGIKGISICILILNLLLFFPNWYYIVRYITNTSLMEYFNALYKPFLLSGFLSPILLFSSYFFISNFIIILLGGAIFIISYYALVTKYDIEIGELIPIKYKITRNRVYKIESD